MCADLHTLRSPSIHLFIMAAEADRLKNAIATAQLKVSDFFAVIDMTDAEFSSWYDKADASKSVGGVLGVGEAFMAERSALHNGNSSLGWKGLRGIFGRTWVKRHDHGLIPRLFEGHVACTRCHGHGADAGLLYAKKNILDDHEGRSDHIARMTQAAAGVPRQADLVEAGFAPSQLRGQLNREARNLIVARLVAGAGGEGKSAAGIPPTAIPALIDADMLTVRLWGVK